MITETLPLALLVVLVKVSLWCLLPFALQPILRKAAAATRHLVLLLVLAGVLVFPVLLLTGPTWFLPAEISPAALLQNTPLVTSSPAPITMSPTVPTNDWQSRSGSNEVRPNHGTEEQSFALLMGSQLTKPVQEVGRFSEGSSSRALSSRTLSSKTLSSKVVSSKDSFSETLFSEHLSPGPGSISTWLLALVVIWLLGFLNALWKVSLSVASVRRTIQAAVLVEDSRTLELLEECSLRVGLQTPPQLRESYSFGIPFAWTSSSPVVVLPPSWRGWDQERLRVVLVHELAHLRRGDGWALWVGRAASCLWWFHPLVRRVEIWARWECERAADDLVLLTGSPASEYAEHLLAIGRPLMRPLPIGVSLMMSSGPDLKSRLRAILSADQPRRFLSRRLTLGGALLALGVAVALAGMQFDSRISAQEPEETARADSRAEAEDRSDSHSRSYSWGYTGQGKHWHHRDDHGKGRSGGLIGEAFEAYQEDRYDEAAERFEAAAAAGMDSATSLYNAACSYALAGRAEEAQETLNRAIDAGWDDVERIAEDSDFDSLRSLRSFQNLMDEAFARAGKTRDVVEHYRYRTAQESLTLLRDKSSKNADAWYEVGTSLLQLRDLEAASEALGRAAELDPENPANAHYNQACALALSGDDRGALKALRSAIEAGYSDRDHIEKDPDLRSLRGNREFKALSSLANDLDLDRFRKAFWHSEGEEGDEGEHEGLARFIKFFKHGKHSENSQYSKEVWAPAIEFYRDFVSEQPGLGVGWFNLGYALHYSSRFNEATDAFQKAADLGFRPSLSTYNVACGLSMLNRVDEALTALEKSFAAGFSAGHLEGDQDLDNLRGEPRFRKLVLEQKLSRKGHHH